jgi:hypothetical protein
LKLAAQREESGEARVPGGAPGYFGERGNERSRRIFSPGAITRFGEVVFDVEMVRRKVTAWRTDSRGWRWAGLAGLPGRCGLEGTCRKEGAWAAGWAEERERREVGQREGPGERGRGFVLFKTYFFSFENCFANLF